jgi:hypothetical protein
MSLGYSQQLVEANRRADKTKKSMGVALGRECIKASIPVITVAQQLGVSRTTLYNWFVGASLPKERYVHAIIDFMSSMKKRR